MNEATTCPNCGVPLTKENQAAGRPKSCKPCRAAKQRAYYKANPEIYNKHKGYVAKNDVKWKSRVTAYMFNIFSESNGCVDCGESNLLVLEFDHREPDDKEYGISKLRTKKISWDSFVAEIDKCDIVCANCHRIRTAKMFGNWRLDFLDEV